MKILLVVPRQTRGSTYQIPVGIGYVSASLKRAGHDVAVLNPNHSSADLPVLLQTEIRKRSPEVVMYGGMAFHMAETRLVAATARNLLPRAVIVIGGPLVSNQPEAVMRAVIEADFGVIGEGEHTAVELLSALQSGSAIDAVRGLIYREAKAHELQRTLPRPIEENLDGLAMCDHEGLGLETYAGMHRPGELAWGLIPDTRTRVMPIMTSRGCPYPCTFCCHEAAGRRYRTRSLDDVFAEIDYGMRRFGINALYIYDDLFCLKRQRLEDFCRRIAPLGLRWMCSMSVVQIDVEVLALMKASGCCCISVGVESMSPAILKSMKKKATREELERALAEIWDAGIAIWSNLIFGDPAETLETARESLEWYANNPRYNLRFAGIGYHPGSRIYDDALKRGLIGDPIDYLMLSKPEINGTALSDEQFRQMRVMCDTYQVLFGDAGRLIELLRADAGNVVARCVCPHCGAEGSCHTVKRTLWEICVIDCPRCNHRYRVPVCIRKMPAPEAAGLLKRLEELLQPLEKPEQWLAKAGEIEALCAQILMHDEGNNRARLGQLRLADAAGDVNRGLSVLENAMLWDPFNPDLFELMAGRLASRAEHGGDAKFSRKALQLRAAGVTHTTYIQNA